MDKPLDPSAISGLWAILVSLVMALLAIGGFRAKVATKEDLRKTEESMRVDLQKSEDEMLARLYQKNGTSIFVPRVECEKSQTSCGDRVCAKLGEIQRVNSATMAEMRADTQRRHEEHIEAQREHLRLHGELAEFVGAVKQFMQQHKEG